MTSSASRAAPLWAFPVFGYVRGFACCRKCARVSQAVTCWRMWSCATTERTYPVGVDDHIDPSRSAIPDTSGLWIGRRFWRLTSPAKGRCPSADAGAEGLAAGRDAFTIERGHPTLPLHRPCGRSPSPWQGRFCPGLSFRPAPHPPAMHPRRGGHWPSAAGTIKQNTPMQISTRLGFTNLHRRVAFWGMIPRTSDAAQSGGLCCILSPLQGHVVGGCYGAAASSMW